MYRLKMAQMHFLLNRFIIKIPFHNTASMKLLNAGIYVILNNISTLITIIQIEK